MSEPVPGGIEDGAPAGDTGAPKLSQVDPAGIPADGPQRPEYLPEKFWKDGQADLEALAKSYASLESRFSQGEAPAAPAPEATPQAAITPDGKIEKPQEQAASEEQPSTLTTAMEAARQQWSESGEVSDEAIAALEEAGIPREVFNLYIAGVKAVQQEALSAIYSYAGSEEQYSRISAWAAANLTDAELEAYNQSLDNPALRENAVRGLAARYAAVIPSEGKLITPNSGAATGGDTYSSRDEFLSDVKDPRYSTDTRYRTEVEAKLARSQRQGFRITEPALSQRVFSAR
ncbi:MAG: hypothetical protein EAZ84_09915 [Verrucomicrobia bacterium]|nr:MAG: hypothetical protein EAZ84_09915 [Verrucomicrobiota bacterium]